MRSNAAGHEHDRRGYPVDCRHVTVIAMLKKPARGLFITGTSTEVGKTHVGALLARALVAAACRVGVYKPAASGCRRAEGMAPAAPPELVSDDAVVLWQAAGQPGTLEAVCPQRFEAPLAPHLAAEAEGKTVDPELLRGGLAYWAGRCRFVIVEGAGGLMSPIADDVYNADLALDFGFPILIVAPNRLGVINQTLQTLITAAAYRGGLPVAGVVLNHVDAAPPDASASTNCAELERRCRQFGSRLLAEIPYSPARGAGAAADGALTALVAELMAQQPPERD